MFTVIGEAVTDLVEEQRDPGHFVAHPGGSPLNVAVALARLGHPTALLARLSTGAFGRRLHEHAERNGVRLDHTVSTTEPATLAVVALDAGGDATYDFYVEGTADRLWRPQELATLPSGTEVVHTGSLACFLPPGADVLHARLTRLAADGRTLISYDPNVRRHLIGPDPAAARHRVERFVAVAHVVKASEEDLRILYPGADPLETLHRWHSSGPRLAVLTLGGAGSVAVTAAGVVRRAADPVDVVDTIGAGDAYTAGLLSALADLRRTAPASLGDLPASVTAAVLARAGLVAALTCARPGADPPGRAEVAGADGPGSGLPVSGSPAPAPGPVRPGRGPGWCGGGPPGSAGPPPRTRRR
jgi:fructokinase